jgi:hypothetical protein
MCSSLEPHECSTLSYFVGCTSTEDARCAMCTQCNEGLYAATSCNSSHDSTCAACVANLSATNSLPENGHWVKQSWDARNGYLNKLEPCSWACDTGYVHDEIEGVCKTCDETCGVGYYNTECTRETKWSGCMPCVGPDHSYASGPGRQTAHSCPWTCQDGFVMAVDGASCVPKITAQSEVVAEEFKCRLTGDTCAVGYYLRFDSSQQSCACFPCATLANASGTIAQFSTPGTCEWICMNPYIRVADVCKTLKDMMRSGSSSGPNHPENAKVDPILWGCLLIPFLFVSLLVTVYLFH